MPLGLMLTRPCWTMVTPTELCMILTPPTLTKNATESGAKELLYYFFAITAFIVFYGSRDVRTAVAAA